VDTAILGVTGIDGAGNLVITVEVGPRGAAAPGAGVTGGANATIIARCGIGQILTPEDSIAGIIGAAVAIVAVRGGAAHAGPCLAEVLCRTGIAVIAGQVIGHKLAALSEVTAIGSTWVIIVTDKKLAPLALPVLALVKDGADLTVVARVLIGKEGAAGIGAAAIVGATVAIIAGQGTTGNARPEMAMVTGSAHVTVVTGGTIEGVGAPT
jgi:hypothetical protein